MLAFCGTFYYVNERSLYGFNGREALLISNTADVSDFYRYRRSRRRNRGRKNEDDEALKISGDGREYLRRPVNGGIQNIYGVASGAE
jgi:hypothetical protein